MTRRDQIDRRISECLKHFNRNDFFHAVVEVRDDLMALEPAIMDRGRIDIWAAALILAVSRHNFRHFKDSRRSLTLEDIAAFYNLKKSTISAKATKIKKELDLGFLNSKYRNLDYSIDEYVNFEPGHRIIVEVVFDTGRKFNRPHRFQLQELVNQLIAEVNADSLPEECLTLNDFNYDSKTLILKLDGFKTYIEYFISRLEEHRLKFIDLSIVYQKFNLYSPGEGYLMFMEQFEIIDLYIMDLDDDSDFESEIKRLMDLPPDELKPLTGESKALIDAIKAYDKPEKESINTVNTILNMYPDCVEAYICLAGWEEDHEKRIDILEDALEAGEKSLDIDEINNEKLWWRNHKTRPYMRAMLHLGLELLMNNYEEEGLEVLEEMIEMNEDDNQGARLFLMESYIINRKWNKASLLFKKYHDDPSLVFVYAKAIYLYYTIGKKAKTKKALIAAYERNIHPFRILAGIEEYPEVSTYCIFGDPVEATEVLELLGSFIVKDKKFAFWVLDTLMSSGIWEDRDEIGLSDYKDDEGAKIIPLA